jgi:thiol:disulfide interchange protein DsbD
VELPHAEQLYRDLQDQGFALLTVTQDPGADVQKMVEYNGITHPIVSDTKDAATGSVYEKYHAYDGKHYLIGSDGRILAAFSKLGVSIPVLTRELAKHGIRPPGAGAPVRTAAPAQSPAASQTARDPVVWAGTAAPPSTAPGAKVSVTLAATLATGWHIYAITQRPGGPTPLDITVAPGQPFTLAGAIKSPDAELKFDPNFGIDVQTFALRAEFTLPVAVAATAPAGKQVLTIEARYQACNASICLPPRTDRVQVPITIAKR